MTASTSSDITRIEAAIATLAQQRAVLGAEAAELAIAALRERAQALGQLGQRPAAAPSPAAFAGERKIVTILYADISGFTALAERSDPETTRDLINACFDRLTPCVERFGGTVDKFIGDAIMALFGAPTAHENDPERALRAALAMMEAIQAFNADHATELGLHIGINTGLVIAGGIGARGWQQYSVMGDAVNIAARLEDLAAHGEILVGPDTYRAGEPLFVFTARKPMLLKGKAQPLPIFQVHGLKSQPAPLRGIAGLRAPLIGRDAELAQLRAAAAGLGRGAGRAIFLVGEAGLGKSRLLAEFRGELPALANDDMPLWMEAQAVAYQAARPYALFQNLFRQMSDLDEHATPAQVAAQLDAMLRRITADGSDTVYPTRTRQVFEVLLGLNDHPQRAQMAGESFQRELFGVVGTMLRARIAAGPLVLAFDDLHWADPASIDLLATLLPAVEAGPLLLICLFRPDRQSPVWQLMTDAAGPRYGDLLAIQPLGPAESQRLVTGLLQAGDLPPELFARILQRAEGNPFFVEEIVRDMIDRGVLARADDEGPWQAADDCSTISIPENLQALLATRIDRLSDEARRTLQLAATIGRTFDYALLAQAAEPGAPLDEQLHALQQSDLIVPVAGSPALSYRFQHTLTQEAAYSSMLFRHRRAFHAQIGAALEQLYPERGDELAPMLAHHFAEAADTPRALDYYRRAGDGAFRLYAHDDAARYYRQALELAQRQPADEGPAAVELLIALFTRFGRTLELRSQFGEALALYEAMAAQGRERGLPQIELAALLAAATIRATPTLVRDGPAGAELAQAALLLARGLGDPAAEAKALWNLQLAATYAGQLADAVGYGEASLAIARAHGLREQLAYTLNDLSLTYLTISGPAAARAALDEARRLWRELGNMPLLADSLSNLGLVEHLVGNVAQARRSLEEAAQICRGINNLWGLSFSLSQLIDIELEAGDMQAALDHAQEAIRVGSQGGLTFAWTIAPVTLGWIYAHLGMLERGIAAAQGSRTDIHSLSPQLQAWPIAIQARLALRAGQHAEASRLIDLAGQLNDTNQFNSFSTFLLPIAAAELAMAQGDHRAALGALDALLERMDAFGVHQFRADSMLLRGAALRQLGRAAEARASLREAVAISEAAGTLRILWPALLAWSDLEAADGRQGRAAELRARARAVIARISARLTDPELRGAFLATEAVRQAQAAPGPATIRLYP